MTLKVYTYRTIWISDLHLGTKGCKAEFLLDFLKYNESEKLYLVGDIIDGWKLRRGWFWPQLHSDIVQKILRKARKGTEVIFIPGNHDEFLRPYDGLKAGSVIIQNQDIHITADGKRLLVVHGDEFDGVMRYAKWLAFVGDRAYGFALTLNDWVNTVRRKLGMPYWSLSAMLKNKVKKAVEIIGNFEEFIVEVAQKKRVDGVVCGHIHHAEMKMIEGTLYCNDGDWVESCTALVEHEDGTLEIVRWADVIARREREAEVMERAQSGAQKQTHIVIVTDAWFPQVNGVVRTLDTTRKHLIEFGHKVTMITPADFMTIPCPTYPEIRLALTTGWKLRQQLRRMRPDFIHIATEGPLGWLTRHYCKKHGIAFTTAYHTKFPEYVAGRLPVSAERIYALLKRFHSASSGVMVATPSMEKTLHSHGIDNTRPWSRGVDLTQFQPSQALTLDYAGPVWLYVGRVSAEKNIEDFLDLQVEGTKLVVGGGPQLQELKTRYPDAVFAGPKFGAELAGYYAAADVFVFPSKTDTFGLVMLEALASGTAVAAYPVTGPIDVILDERVGVLHDDLEVAARQALSLHSADCRAYAERYSWEACARLFEQNLERIT